MDDAENELKSQDSDQQPDWEIFDVNTYRPPLDNDICFYGERDEELIAQIFIYGSEITGKPGVTLHVDPTKGDAFNILLPTGEAEKMLNYKNDLKFIKQELINRRLV